MNYTLLDRLQNLAKPQPIIKVDKLELKKNKKELFKKFKDNIVLKLEELAAKDIKSYQVPIDNWDISDNIQQWCKERGLKFWTSSRKVAHRPPVKDNDLKIDEVRLMMISWE